MSFYFATFPLSTYLVRSRSLYLSTCLSIYLSICLSNPINLLCLIYPLGLIYQIINLSDLPIFLLLIHRPIPLYQPIYFLFFRLSFLPSFPSFFQHAFLTFYHIYHVYRSSLSLHEPAEALRLPRNLHLTLQIAAPVTLRNACCACQGGLQLTANAGLPRSLRLTLRKLPATHTSVAKIARVCANGPGSENVPNAVACGPNAFRPSVMIRLTFEHPRALKPAVVCTFFTFLFPRHTLMHVCRALCLLLPSVSKS